MPDGTERRPSGKEATVPEDAKPIVIGPSTPEDPGAGGGVLDAILKAVKLEWVRPLIYNLGGRKLVVGGGGLAIIGQIVAQGPLDWPKAVACLSVAVVSVGTAFAIASEDKRK